MLSFGIDKVKHAILRQTLDISISLLHLSFKLIKWNQNDSV